jgi:hypothetical protein
VGASVDKLSRACVRTLWVVPAVVILGLCTMVARGLYLARTSSHPKVAGPLFAGLGSHKMAVTTTSRLAQLYFDQGLAFLYAFDANAASLSFRSALDCDPACAMAYWGIAMANGPCVNNEFPPATHEIKAWSAVREARKRQEGVTPVERALIEALGSRHADPPPRDRRQLDSKYADAMRRVWRMFPTDSDVGALTAEAIMLLHSRNLWKPDGTPQPGTNELIKVLNDVLALDPDHPFAVHLLVHSFEGSTTPEKADVAADKLRTLASGLHHLLHMPSHVDIRRGRWREAVLTSEHAVAAGASEQRITHGFSPTAVDMVHNYHMLAYCAMMQGQSRTAADAVDGMLSSAWRASIDQRYSLDGFLAMRYESHLRFGRWKEMLSEAQPPISQPMNTGLWHYARGVAFAAKKQIYEARTEHAAVMVALKSAAQNATFRDVPASQLIALAERMLAGEILYRQGSVDNALAVLGEAVKQEDKLPLSLPPVWLVHARHALGATLMDAQRYRIAEIVYRADLSQHPENGWSLYGLAESLRMQGKSSQAALIRRRFETAWRDADFPLSSSCCCLPGRVARQIVTAESVHETAATDSQTRKGP